MSVINFDSEILKMDWISFSLDGLLDPRIISGRLLNYFTPYVRIDDKQWVSWFPKKVKSFYSPIYGIEE